MNGIDDLVRSTDYHDELLEFSEKVIEDMTSPAGTLTEPPVDAVNHPKHYGQGTYEAIKVIEAADFPAKLAFHLGNTLKYVLRAGKKDPNKLVEDLKKARWYLDRAIQRAEAAE